MLGARLKAFHSDLWEAFFLAIDEGGEMEEASWVVVALVQSVACIWTTGGRVVNRYSREQQL